MGLGFLGLGFGRVSWLPGLERCSGGGGQTGGGVVEGVVTEAAGVPLSRLRGTSG